MKLCDDGHDEVCYEVRNCPACVLKDELETANSDHASKVKELEEKIDKLNES